MKQVKRRTWFCLMFTLILSAGLFLFLWRYCTDGGDWASFRANRHIYDESGRLLGGTVRDRNGNLLYNASESAYSDEKTVRISTLHAVGDRGGNIATGALRSFGDKIGGYNPLLGTTAGGHDLYLSIDERLNAAAYEALKGKKGTVGVYNYTTGEILCMVSLPSFDPSDPPQIKEGDSRYEGVYLNRFLSGVYTPGSVFKTVTAAAALERILDAERRTFTCTGRTEIGGDIVTCPSAHGTMDLSGALANSCNGAFAALAVELGGTTMSAYAKKAGLTDSFTVDGIRCASGSYETAEDGSTDLGWSGVGQYRDQVNPCAMMRYMGAVAGGGSAAQPRLLTRHTMIPSDLYPKETFDSGLRGETCAALRAMMRNNVLEHYGQSQFGDLAVCAKSGTAEVGGNARPHAWFTGFIDDAAHPLAFVVVVENGGSGAKTAGTVAAKVLTAAADAGY